MECRIEFFTKIHIYGLKGGVGGNVTILFYIFGTFLYT